MLGGIVKIYPAQLFLQIMRWFFRHLVCSACLLLIACIQLSDAAEPGHLEGHLKIGSRKEVELAETGPSKATEQNYPDYPLVILSKAGQKEVARVTPDQGGNYRVSLPPGDYILDVQGRGPSNVRAEPQPFTVVSGQTVRVDMNIGTGIR
jgi:hypothetical protein